MAADAPANDETLKPATDNIFHPLTDQELEPIKQRISLQLRAFRDEAEPGKNIQIPTGLWERTRLLSTIEFLRQNVIRLNYELGITKAANRALKNGSAKTAHPVPSDQDLQQFRLDCERMAHDPSNKESQTAAIMMLEIIAMLDVRATVIEGQKREIEALKTEAPKTIVA